MIFGRPLRRLPSLFAQAICAWLAGSAVALGFLALGAVVLSPASLVHAEDEPVAAEPVPADKGQADLDRLKDNLGRSKTTSDELLSDLNAVERAYHNLTAPEGVDPVKFTGVLEKFKKEAEKQFAKALKLVKVNHSSDTNDREEVNVRAAQILCNTGNIAVSDDIRAALDRTILDPKKYEVTPRLLEETFAALGKLNDKKSLEWLADEFIHTKNQPAEVERLIAAHKAMIMFKDVPGKLRHAIVEKMVKTYSSSESLAEQSSTDKNVQAAKQFWDRVKNDAIKVVQYYAMEPTDESGQVLATMGEFEAWWRDHKSANKAPWADPKN